MRASQVLDMTWEIKHSTLEAIMTLTDTIDEARTAYHYLKLAIAPHTNFGIWEHSHSKEELLKAFIKAIALAEEDERSA